MAKATVKRPKVVVPPGTVTLVLSEAEAATIQNILGNTYGYCEMVDSIHGALYDLSLNRALGATFDVEDGKIQTRGPE